MDIPTEITQQQPESKKPERKSPSDSITAQDYLSMTQEQVKQAVQEMKERQEKLRWKDRKTNFDQSVADYFDRLHNEKSREFTYADARIKFYKIWRRMVGSAPFIAEQDAWIPREIVKWIIRDQSCELDLKKGILLCGIQGCGKSTLMKAAMVLSGHAFQFRRIAAIKIEIEEFKSVTAMKPYFKGSWCFDDIGQENEDIVVFTKHNIVKSLINTRITSSHPTHGTTNLMPDEIEDRYGKVISSRFNELFNPVIFESEIDCRKI